DAAGAGPAHPAVAAAEGDRRRQPPDGGCRRAAPRPRGRGHRGGARVALSAAGEALCPVGAGEGLGEVSDPPGLTPLPGRCSEAIHGQAWLAATVADTIAEP